MDMETDTPPQPGATADPAPAPEDTPQEDASTSGRLALLSTLFEKCLSYGLRRPSVKALSARFPTLPEATVAALYDLYSQVLDQIRGHSLAEFTQIAEEHDIAAKLAEIEQLAQQTGTTTSTASTSTEAAARVARATAWLEAQEDEEVMLQQQLYEAKDARRRLQALVSTREAAAAQLNAQYKSIVESFCSVLKEPSGGAATTTLTTPTRPAAATTIMPLAG